MTNTSATGGYLTPSSPPVLHDDPFVTLLQNVVVGIVGLASSNVRPRWQPIPPQWPPLTTDWASVGVIAESDLSQRPQTRHDPTGNGSDVVENSVRNRVLLSFYGPNCFENAGLLCDGLKVAQNRDALVNASIGLVSISGRRNVPELINQRWLQRVDIEVTLNRQIQRVYPVLNLLSAVGTTHMNPPGKSTVIDEGFDTNTPTR